MEAGAEKTFNLPACPYSIFVALPSSASVMADGLAGIRDEIIRSLYASLD